MRKGEELNTNVKLPVKHLYVFLLTSAAIVFLNSIEVLFYVKDTLFFEEWAHSFDGQLYDGSFDMYVTARLSQYAMKVVIPTAFALYCYASFKYIRINTLFVFMWTVLVAGGLAYNLVGLEARSFLFPAYIVLHAVLLAAILSLVPVIRASRTE